MNELLNIKTGGNQRGFSAPFIITDMNQHPTVHLKHYLVSMS